VHRPSLWSALSLRTRLILIATVPQLLYTNVMTWLGNRTLRHALANLTVELADYPDAVRMLNEIYADDQKLIFVGASLALGLIAAGLATRMADRIRARIATLCTSAARIASGDLATPVGLTGKSEIGRLGATLEQVRATLGQRIALETEARALEKDLALAATVDQLLLPSQDRIEGADFRIAAFHRGAARCSGDFWTYHLGKDGQVWLLLGDVSGTGAGPAMVAASVVTSFRTAVRGGGLSDVPQLLRRMHQTVAITAGDRHPTALALLELGRHGKARFWSAGSEPLLLVSKSGDAQWVQGGGQSLGSGESVAQCELTLDEGDLLLCCTSGLLSTGLRGRVGPQAIADILVSLRGASPVKVREALSRALPDEASNALAEDVTFAAISRAAWALS